MEYIYCKRQDIGKTNRKMQLVKKNVIRLSELFQTPWMWSILPVTCLGRGVTLGSPF